MTCTRDPQVHVVRDGAALGAFSDAAARSALAGPLGRIAPWTPALDPALFPPIGADEADFFLIPVSVSCLETTDWPIYSGMSERACLLARAVMEDALEAAVSALVSISSRPERLVFLQFGDHAEPFAPLMDGWVVKVSVDRVASRCICLPYYLEEFGWRKDLLRVEPFDACEQDFFFLGDMTSHKLRRELPAAASALTAAGLAGTVDHVNYADCQNADRDRYIAELCRSRYVLCPRGAGLNSLRFYEALAFGRIPILLADDTALPLDWRIGWDRFTIRVPECDIGRIACYIEDFRQRSRPSLAARYARSVYEQHLRLSGAGELIRESLHHLAGPGHA